MTTEGASQLVIRYPPSTSSTEALLEIVGSSHRLHTRNPAKVVRLVSINSFRQNYLISSACDVITEIPCRKGRPHFLNFSLKAESDRCEHGS